MKTIDIDEDVFERQPKEVQAAMLVAFQAQIDARKQGKKKPTSSPLAVAKKVVRAKKSSTSGGEVKHAVLAKGR